MQTAYSPVLNDIHCADNTTIMMRFQDIGFRYNPMDRNMGSCNDLYGKANSLPNSFFQFPCFTFGINLYLSTTDQENLLVSN